MYRIEVTDTFNGGANYAWRVEKTTHAKTRRGLIKAIKRIALWKGWCRVRVHYFDGHLMEIRPVGTSGIAQVAFATFEE